MGDISRKDVETWYASAVDSGFGNVALQQTQHDAKIRSSREFDASNFSVEQKTLDKIADTWARYFVPESVVAQPYKLVIYGPGDHFSVHKDTPERNLCGTFLISLFEDCEPKGVFEISQDGDSQIWSSDQGKWVVRLLS